MSVPRSPKLYSYVGRSDLRRAGPPTGVRITSPEHLQTWLQHQDDRRADNTVAATFVIDEVGSLLIAERHAEHVHCAGGQPVRAAGEMFIAVTKPRVLEISNQSIGYCPEPSSWLAVAAALDAIPVPHPGGYTWALEFRRCMRCAALNVIKDGWYVCACCDADLPPAWNLDSRKT